VTEVRNDWTMAISLCIVVISFTYLHVGYRWKNLSPPPPPSRRVRRAVIHCFPIPRMECGTLSISYPCCPHIYNNYLNFVGFGSTEFLQQEETLKLFQYCTFVSLRV
jgi:hypothetical protein